MFALAATPTITTMMTAIGEVVTGMLVMITEVLSWVMSEPLLVFFLGLGILYGIISFGRSLIRNRG